MKQTEPISVYCWALCSFVPFSSANHLLRYWSLGQRSDIPRPATTNSFGMSDEKFALHGVLVSRSGAEVAETILRRAVVGWWPELDVVDPFAWGLRFAYDNVSIGVADETIGNLSHLRSPTPPVWDGVIAPSRKTPSPKGSRRIP